MRGLLLRLLALAAAAGMVVGALAVRDRLGDGAAAGGSDGAGAGSDDGQAVLGCVSDLADLCRALVGGTDIAVESRTAADVVAELSAAGGPAVAQAGRADAWLWPAPWPAMVAEARGRAGLPGLLGESSPPLARSPLVLVLPDDRQAVLADHCDGLGWACLGSVAGGTWADLGGPGSWGPLKPGHQPGTDAIGLLTLGQAAADQVGRADFSTRDLESDDFRRWFNTLEQAVPTFAPPAGTPLATMLQFGPSFFDTVGAVEADAARLLRQAGARGEEYTVVWPAPAMTVDLVVTPVRDRADSEAVVEALQAEDATAVLAQRGWHVEGPAAGDRPQLPDAPALPPTAGTPPPGALQALQQFWEEVAR